jgi:hypothetical protein
LKKYLALEIREGVFRGGAGGEACLARVNNLITELMDLKIHSMVDNFEDYSMVRW